MYRRYTRKGGPAHPGSTDQMSVNMENTLQGIVASIKNQPVAGFSDTDDFCHRSCSKKNMTGYRFIFRSEIVERSDMFYWNDEDMLLRYRRDVPECNDMIITINNRSGNLTAHNTAKQTISFLLFHKELLLWLYVSFFIRASLNVLQPVSCPKRTSAHQQTITRLLAVCQFSAPRNQLVMSTVQELSGETSCRKDTQIEVKRQRVAWLIPACRAATPWQKKNGHSAAELSRV